MGLPVPRWVAVLLLLLLPQADLADPRLDSLSQKWCGMARSVRASTLSDVVYRVSVGGCGFLLSRETGR